MSEFIWTPRATNYSIGQKVRVGDKPAWIINVKISGVIVVYSRWEYVKWRVRRWLGRI